MKLFLISIFCCCNLLYAMDGKKDAQAEYLTSRNALKNKLEELIAAIPEQQPEEEFLHAVKARMQLRTLAMKLFLLPDNIEEGNKEEAVTLFQNIKAAASAIEKNRDTN